MAYKPELWAEAKKKCRLNEEDIRMAKEMGLNPKRLIKNIPSPREQWKCMKKGIEKGETERHRLSGAVFFCIPVHVSPNTFPVEYTAFR